MLNQYIMSVVGIKYLHYLTIHVYSVSSERLNHKLNPELQLFYSIFIVLHQDIIGLSKGLEMLVKLILVHLTD